MATVLVIDDEPTLVQLLTLWLEMHGHQVLTAAHGEAGLQTLEQAGVDIILVDMMMPHMDGITFIRHLREKGYDQRVIVLSALPGNPDLEEAGVIAQIRKPLSARDRNELLRLISAWAVPHA
ncbi:MAG: response regulator [Oleiphilaceae bacterium]|nr:response regulator [Oleiphilaceae bacterium]